ncbi:hypothetical protein AB0C47_16100 [Micromonospora taraxaci]|uniref:hypothetical protein n=1 Tax=Micromonospora taraxaci TaxID=1316803 RepID=UPI0033C837EE
MKQQTKWQLIAVPVEVLAAVGSAVATNVVTDDTRLATIVLLVVAVALHITVVTLLKIREARVAAVKFDRAAALIGLEQRSIVRVRERLLSLQIPTDVVDQIEARWRELAPPITFPDERDLTVITGELGSGKSTSADMLHRNAIQRARSDPAAPWPAFLMARDLTVEKLEQALRAEGPPDETSWHVVIDGLDEVGRDQARDFLSQARRIGLLSPGSRFFLLSRPGYLSIDADATIGLLTDKQTDLILEVVGGEHLRRWSLPRGLQEEVRKPLFALLSARYLSYREPRFRTPIELLGALAEEVLDRESESGIDVHASLRGLAVKSMRGRGRVAQRDAGPLEVRQALVATRLVVRHGNVLRFASPILEQYFAARALLRGEVPLDPQLASLQSWELWRPAWLLAAAMGTWDDSAGPIAALIAAHPGAAAWILGEAVPLHDHPRRDNGEDQDQHHETPASPARLRFALETWGGAVPHLLAPWGVGPISNPELDVFLTATDDWIDVRVGKKSAHKATQHLPRVGLDVSRHPAAPWRAAQALAEKSAIDLLTAMRRDPDIDVLRREKWHDLAAGLMPTSMGPAQYARHAAMSFTERVAEYGRLLLARMDEHAANLAGNGRRQYTRAEVQELVEIALEDDPEGRLADPWTGRDPGPFPPDAVWSGYSSEQLTARVKAVHLAAIKAYAEIVRRYFPSLSTTMERAVLAPYRVECHLFLGGAIAGIATVLVPLADGEEITVEVAIEDSQDLDAAYDRERLDEVHRLVMARRLEGAPWVRTSVQGGRLPVLDRMPATQLATGWVWRDLRKLNLITKTPPHSL